MYYYIVVLKNLAKLTGMHLHRNLFSTCNLQLHRKRDAGIYRFRWVLRNFLGTLLSWKTSCGLVLKGEFYGKWITNICIIIKIYREVHSFIKKTDIVRENVSLRDIDRKLTLNLIVIFNSFTDIYKIFCISYYFQEKIWQCFKVQISVTLFVYILSSKGANHMQVLYRKTLGNIQENFSTEIAILKCIIPSIFSGNLQKF